MRLRNRFAKALRESINKVILNRKISNLEKLFDLSKIPKNVLDRCYRDVSRIRPFEGVWNPLFKDKEGKYVFENDARVTPADEVKRAIENKYGLEDWQFIIIRKNYNIEFCVCIADFPGSIREITEDFEQMGYFLSISLKHKDSNGREWRKMQFEPKYQMDQSREILYKGDLKHWTPKYNLENILREGLKPKSENSYLKYPDRIFLFAGDTPQAIVDLFWRVLNKNNRDKRNNGEYVLLNIDSKKMLRNNFSVYYDANMPFAVYTEQTIPPDFIDVVNNASI